MNLLQILYMGAPVLSVLTTPSGLIHPTASYRRIKGKYSVKEEIVKRVERIHPCSLEATAVKVTFPGIKSEVLVSFLGYKEPNLIHVNRCKGTCVSSSPRNNLACVPLRRNMKKIRMHLQTQVIGSQKKRDKVRELVLEEHMECGCACLALRASACPYPSFFSNETCACSCEPSPEMNSCFGYNRHWDTKTCSCLTVAMPPLQESPEIGGLEGHGEDDHGDGDSSFPYMHRIGKIQQKDIDHFPPCGHCLECMNMAGISSVYKKIHGGAPLVKSWVVLAFSLTLILLLFGSTLHYWRKSQALLKSLRRDGDLGGGEEAGKHLFLDSAIPLELLDHQINFDHNGDGTTAELFNTSSSTFIPPSSNTTFIPPSSPPLGATYQGSPRKAADMGNGLMTSGRPTEETVTRSSRRHGERRKRHKGTKHKEKAK